MPCFGRLHAASLAAPFAASTCSGGSTSTGLCACATQTLLLLWTSEQLRCVKYASKCWHDFLMIMKMPNGSRLKQLQAVVTAQLCLCKLSLKLPHHKAENQRRAGTLSKVNRFRASWWTMDSVGTAVPRALSMLHAAFAPTAVHVRASRLSMLLGLRVALFR